MSCRPNKWRWFLINEKSTSSCKYISSTTAPTLWLPICCPTGPHPRESRASHANTTTLPVSKEKRAHPWMDCTRSIFVNLCYHLSVAEFICQWLNVWGPCLKQRSWATSGTVWTLNKMWSRCSPKLSVWLGVWHSPESLTTVSFTEPYNTLYADIVQSAPKFWICYK